MVINIAGVEQSPQSITDMPALISALITCFAIFSPVILESLPTDIVSFEGSLSYLFMYQQTNAAVIS